MVTLNLPQIGIIANKDEDVFWKLLDERLLLVKEALDFRLNTLRGTTTEVAPILWEHGAIARLEKGEKIDKLLEGGYSTLSIGYIGLYETVKLMRGVSHTQDKEFALKIMRHIRETIDKWKAESGLGYALYSSPAESLCYRFAKIDKETFGEIEDINDKDWYCNSYHVNPTEEIDVFSKLDFESEFQNIASGGCISYVEIPNMGNNLSALKDMIKYVYDNIQYAEFNIKSDYCQVCGFDGEIIINDDNEWECPQCHNKQKDRMNVVRRTWTKISCVL